jgi:anti-sigma factor RsiW
MAVDPKQSDEVLLNALVDGELAPGEHAAAAARLANDREFARAYATLARLKAQVSEGGGPTSLRTPLPVRKPRRLALGLGMATAAVCAIAALIAVAMLPSQNKPVALAAREAVLTLAALPASPVIPDLEQAGLALVDLAVDRAGDIRLLIATYRGPHGCRLDLRVRPLGAAVPPIAGTRRHDWEVSDLAYELVAHGMPGWRFAMIAAAAERETRNGRLPEPGDRQLREARVGAPPCLG